MKPEDELNLTDNTIAVGWGLLEDFVPREERPWWQLFESVGCGSGRLWAHLLASFHSPLPAVECLDENGGNQEAFGHC